MQTRLPRTAIIHQGDALKALKTLPSDSIHMVMTSPPYWGLRDYGFSDQLGQEAHFEFFLAKLRVIFREIKRVLHPTGTVWLNMGDSYNGNKTSGTFGDQSKHGYLPHGHDRIVWKGIHRKSLIGQPQRLVLSLLNDKWIWRDSNIWSKPNPMPYSGRDRNTRSHEDLFMLTKSGKYFFNYIAIQEEAEGEGFRRKRTVWSIPTQGFRDAHFATFPYKLVEPPVLAGTSSEGCCSKCLMPIFPVYTEEQISEHGGYRKRADAPGAVVSESSVFRTGKITHYGISHWEKRCECDSQIIPCTVLDPFSGSGTTGVVANKLGRNYIGIEMSEKYAQMSLNRIRNESKNRLFDQFDLYVHT